MDSFLGKTACFSLFFTFLFVPVEGFAAIEDLVNYSVSIESDKGKGSGVLIDSSGVIATNYHVIEDAEKLLIKLNNGDRFSDIGVIDIDENRDIALLKVKGFDLPFATFGNSNDYVIGEEVIAIGAPIGYEGTVTKGILSATRFIEEKGYKLFQIDAAISPGSSGGGVYNAQEELIGIVVSSSRNAQNINFAIPINYFRGLYSTEVKAPFQDFFNSTKVAQNGDPGFSKVVNPKYKSILQYLANEFGVPYQVFEDSEDIFYFEIEEIGRIVAYFKDEAFALWKTLPFGEEHKNNSFLMAALKLNISTESILSRVGINQDEDRVWVITESPIASVSEQNVESVVLSHYKMLSEVIDLIQSPDFSSASQARPNFEAYSRDRQLRRLTVLDGQLYLDISRDYKKIKSENPEEGGKITDYQKPGILTLRVIEEPNFSWPYSNMRSLLQEILDNASEDQSVAGYKIIEDGMRSVDGKEVYWANAKWQSDGVIEMFAEYNILSSNQGGLLQVAVVATDKEVAIKEANEIIRTLRYR